MNYTVTWSVEFYDADKVYTTEEQFEAENLDSLFDSLDEGLSEDLFMPEDDVPSHDGDFNIEYVIIKDETGKEVYRDADFKK